MGLCTETVIERVAVYIPFDQLDIGFGLPQLAPVEIDLAQVKTMWKETYGLDIDNFTLFEFLTHEDGRLAVRYAFFMGNL